MYEISIARLKPTTDTERYPNHTKIYKRVVEFVDVAAISEVVEQTQRDQEISQLAEPHLIKIEEKKS